jgi:hypothetical protein
MPLNFEPRLDILPASQQILWPELDRVPEDFVLYGGTGLALQLGQRASEDFDFFSSSGFDPDRLRSRLPFLKDLDLADPEVWVHRKRNNLEAFVHRAGGVVKVAFFGGLDTLQRVVEDPSRAVGSRVRVASLVDLAGMKMRHPGARKLEGLRGYPCARLSRDRCTHGSGGGTSHRPDLRPADQSAGAAVLWRRDARSGAARHAAGSDALGASRGAG